MGRACVPFFVMSCANYHKWEWIIRYICIVTTTEWVRNKTRRYE